MVDRGREQPDDPHGRRLQRRCPRTARSSSGRRSWSRRPSRGTRRCRRRGWCQRRPRSRRRAGPARPGAARGARSPAAAPAQPAAPAPMGSYTVRPGDTLSGLAAGAGVRMGDMAAMNGLDPAAPLLAGTVIKLPTRRARAGAAAEPGARADRRPGGRAGADADRASAPATSSRWPPPTASPPSLAAAIAWQESGFNNAMVSARERPRRDAGHAGHVDLGAGQPRRPPARPQLRDRQRPRRRALPQAHCSPRPAATRTPRSPATTRASAPSARAACSTTRSATSRTCRRCAGRFGG